MSGLGSTPWVDSIVSASWDRLQAAGVPTSDLPNPESARFYETLPDGSVRLLQRRVPFKEFGCGHYGCVMPTIGNPGVVCKLTSDATEAFLIGHLLTDTEQPEYGLVQYHQILAAGVQHRRRPVFFIWREEAFDVGFMRGLDTRNIPDPRSYREGSDYLKDFLDAAAAVRDSLKRSLKNLTGSDLVFGNARATEMLAAVHKGFRDRVGDDLIEGSSMYRLRGFARIQAGLSHCRMLAELMEHTYHWDAIGHALGSMLEEGFLLADVHTGNIGKDAEGRMLITDPGHAVPIDPDKLSFPHIDSI